MKRRPNDNRFHQSSTASALRKHESKRVVKNWLALICAIPIRSLRTKWSRIENKAVVLVVSLPRQGIGCGRARPTAQDAN